MNTANIAAHAPSASALHEVRRHLRGMEEGLHEAKDVMAAIYLMGVGLRSVGDDNAAPVETVATIGERLIDGLVGSYRNTWASLKHLPESEKEADDAAMADLHAWRLAYDASYDEVGTGPLWDAKCAMDNRIMAQPASTGIGFAVKLLVLTEYGEHDLERDRLRSILDDAKRVVGVAEPEKMAAWRAECELRNAASASVQEGGAA